MCFKGGINYVVSLSRIHPGDVKPKLERGIFTVLRDPVIFMNRCKIMNDTLAWDLSRENDPTNCIDTDPDTLYTLQHTEELGETG